MWSSELVRQARIVREGKIDKKKPNRLRVRFYLLKNSSLIAFIISSSFFGSLIIQDRAVLSDSFVNCHLRETLPSIHLAISVAELLRVTLVSWLVIFQTERII